MDETSTKKGHNYITVFADLEQLRVIDIEVDKDAKTFSYFVSYLQSKGGYRNEIKHICMDMSRAFITGAKEVFPSSQITFDKFHIVQHLNNAMDSVRKKERVGNSILKGHKYTFLQSNKTLSEKKRNELENINTLYPTLGEAYRLKEIFLDIFRMENKNEAKECLELWCKSVVKSGIMPFVQFVDLVKSHWNGIVNYFDSRITNGILEGINSKIQLAKRRA